MVKNKKYKRLPIKLSEENLWSVCAYLHCNILAPTRISNEAESRASLVTARAVLVNKTVWVGTRLRVLFYFVHQASHSQADSAHLWPRSYWLPWLGAQSYVLQKVFPFCWISNFFSFTQVSIFFNYSLDSCSISSYCTVCAVILSWSSNENFYRPKICFSIFGTTRRTTLCILYFWWWLDLFVRSNCICVGSDRPSGGRNIFEVWTLNCNIV